MERADITLPLGPTFIHKLAYAARGMLVTFGATIYSLEPGFRPDGTVLMVLASMSSIGPTLGNTVYQITTFLEAAVISLVYSIIIIQLFNYTGTDSGVVLGFLTLYAFGISYSNVNLQSRRFSSLVVIVTLMSWASGGTGDGTLYAVENCANLIFGCILSFIVALIPMPSVPLASDILSQRLLLSFDCVSAQISALVLSATRIPTPVLHLNNIEVEDARNQLRKLAEYLEEEIEGPSELEELAEGGDNAEVGQMPPAPFDPVPAVPGSEVSSSPSPVSPGLEAGPSHTRSRRDSMTALQVTKSMYKLKRKLSGLRSRHKLGHRNMSNSVNSMHPIKEEMEESFHGSPLPESYSASESIFSIMSERKGSLSHRLKSSVRGENSRAYILQEAGKQSRDNLLRTDAGDWHEQTEKAYEKCVTGATEMGYEPYDVLRPFYDFLFELSHSIWRCQRVKLVRKLPRYTERLRIWTHSLNRFNRVVRMIILAEKAISLSPYHTAAVGELSESMCGLVVALWKYLDMGIKLSTKKELVAERTWFGVLCSGLRCRRAEYEKEHAHLLEQEEEEFARLSAQKVVVESLLGSLLTGFSRLRVHPIFPDSNLSHFQKSNSKAASSFTQEGVNIHPNEDDLHQQKHLQVSVMEKLLPLNAMLFFVLRTVELSFRTLEEALPVNPYETASHSDKHFDAIRGTLNPFHSSEKKPVKIIQQATVSVATTIWKKFIAVCNYIGLVPSKLALKRSIKFAATICLATALGTATQVYFNSPSPYWAPSTAAMVSGSLTEGGTWKRSTARLTGTASGALFGYLLILLSFNELIAIAVFLSLWSAICQVLRLDAEITYAAYVAELTAAIVVVGPGVYALGGENSNTVQAALDRALTRVLQNVLGVMCVIFIALIFFPVSSRDQLKVKAFESIDACGKSLRSSVESFAKLIRTVVAKDDVKARGRVESISANATTAASETIETVKGTLPVRPPSIIAAEAAIFTLPTLCSEADSEPTFFDIPFSTIRSDYMMIFKSCYNVILAIRVVRQCDLSLRMESHQYVHAKNSRSHHHKVHSVMIKHVIDSNHNYVHPLPQDVVRRNSVEAEGMPFTDLLFHHPATGSSNASDKTKHEEESKESHSGVVDEEEKKLITHEVSKKNHHFSCCGPEPLDPLESTSIAGIATFLTVLPQLSILVDTFEELMDACKEILKPVKDEDIERTMVQEVLAFFGLPTTLTTKKPPSALTKAPFSSASVDAVSVNSWRSSVSSEDFTGGSFSNTFHSSSAPVDAKAASYEDLIKNDIMIDDADSFLRYVEQGAIVGHNDHHILPLVFAFHRISLAVDALERSIVAYHATFHEEMNKDTYERARMHALELRKKRALHCSKEHLKKLDEVLKNPRLVVSNIDALAFNSLSFAMNIIAENLLVLATNINRIGHHEAHRYPQLQSMTTG
jgi:Fusaric acid resistance protein family